MAGRGWHNRGYLPHFDADDVVQHVVIRLADSLPAAVMDKLERLSPVERRRTLDKTLDSGAGAALLRDPHAADLVARALMYFDGERYVLFAWCVMPNHVHAVLGPIQGYELGSILRSWKAFTAAKINALYGRSGRLWAADYYDRYMRNEEQYLSTVAYVEDNPVAAGLCERPEDWPYSSAGWKERA